MPLTSGTLLGPYEILAPIGAGGMGEVYRARDSRLGREVAIKVLPAELADDLSRRQRFEIEARAVAALNHPNIVAIHDVGTADGVFYIVSELVDGESLRGAKMTIRKVLDVAAQIASGLAAAHLAGITHRDLKPDNVLLNRAGRVKILDFGLAKMSKTPAPGAISETVTVNTEPGVVMGTVGYMSPEQVRGQAVSERSDIFSLGVILYELLAGERPFRGETSVDTMQAILRREPPELPESVPAAIRQTVAHCLEKEPEHRFQSAKDLSFALTQIGTQSGSSPVVAERTRWPRWAAIALTAGMVGGMIGTFFRRAPESLQWSGTMLGGPEMALDPRIAPDGHLLAFQAIDRGLTQVAVMKPESGNWSILTHRRDLGVVWQISWSPDGALIYYDRQTDVLQGTYSVPLLGGEERLLLANAGYPEALPDGSLLVVRSNNQRQLQFHRFWPETGRVVDLPLLGASLTDRFQARAVPGGKEAIIYGTPIGNGDPRPGLFAFDLASNRLRRVAPATYHDEAILTFAVGHDGKSILAVKPADALVRVVSIPTSGPFEERTLFTATSNIRQLDSGSGGSVYATVADRPTDVVQLAVGREPAARIASFPQLAYIHSLMALPDGRFVVPASGSAHVRLMAVEKGKEPAPLLNTTEETASPMTVAGKGEIAFAIGPEPHATIGVGEIASGRIVRKITPGKGAIDSLTSSPDGRVLYFAAGGTIWAVATSGGDAMKIAPGDSVVMEPSGSSLVVERNELARIRLFRVRLDGAPEREISIEGSVPLMPRPLSPNAIDAKGRLLVALLPQDSWFDPVALLDTATGRVSRVTDDLSDHQSSAWTPDGHIVTLQQGLRATLWKFTPEGH
jgi:Tol biopolymer transport system component